MNGILAARMGQRGAALVVCLLIMAVLSLLGAAMITSSVIELKITGNQRASKVDFYAADGGVRLVTTRLSSPADPVGNVAHIEVPNVALTPSASDVPDPSLGPDWAVYHANTAPAWGGPSLPFDYHYRVWYVKKANPPKGYSVGSFAGYYYEVDCLGDSTAVSNINTKIGPK
jgi:hypothetical protein